MIINTSQSSIVKDGLVLWLDAGHSASYPKAGTTWYDISGNGNNGALTNGPTYDSANKGSIVFDGVNDYVDINNISLTGEFTMSCWLRLSSFSPSDRMIFGEDSGSGVGGPKIGFSGSSYFVRIISTSNASIASPALNTWEHFTITRNSANKIDLYRNAGSANRLFSDAAQSGTYTLDKIGVNGSDNTQPFNGKLNNITVYNRALSPSEIRQNFNAQKGRYGIATVPWTPSELSSLRAWYDADDTNTITESGGAISQWNDKSGGGYHLSQATAANKPTYTTNTLNGRAVIEFDGNNDTLDASTPADWTFLHDSTGSTLAIILKMSNTANPDDIRVILGNTPNTQGIAGYRLNYDDRSSVSRNDQIRHTIGSTTTEPISNFANDTISFNSATQIVVTSDPNNNTAVNRSAIYIDGDIPIKANTLNTSPSSGSPTNALQIGCDHRNDLYFLGYIAEIVICNAVLSQSDREKLEGYLANKWGLAANLPSTHPYKQYAPFKVLT